MEIIKAKLINGYSMEVEYTEPHRNDEGDFIGNIEISKKIPYEAHDDLKNALDALRIHLALLCELVPEEVVMAFGIESPANDPYIEKVKVNGFSIGGDGEFQGVTLIGRKKLKTDKILNLNAPFTKWEDEHCPYSYSSELYSSVYHAIDEVIAYIGGKKKPSNQLELELN